MKAHFKMKTTSLQVWYGKCLVSGQLTLNSTSSFMFVQEKISGSLTLSVVIVKYVYFTVLHFLKTAKAKHELYLLNFLMSC